jgi:integrase
MSALPEPINLMFYLGNRSGLRTGELAGLRMSDLRYRKDGLIRIRYSYDGPLKEDKGEVGKMKWCPRPTMPESS